MILRRENYFCPERRSKVVKFAKNDRLHALIVLARDEQFLIFPWMIFCLMKPYNIACFLLVYNIFYLTRLIKPHKTKPNQTETCIAKEYQEL